MWKTLSSKEIFKHKRITIIEDEVELPDGYKTDYIKYGNIKDAVGIIALNEEGKILMINDHCYPCNKFLNKFPGGSVDEGESLEMAANRELREEGGYSAKNFQLIGKFLNDSRRSDKFTYIFLASDLQVDKLPHDKTEYGISSFFASEEEIDKMIKKGEILNKSVLASWSFYKLK